MPIFDRDRSIFTDKDVLRESYQPDRIEERDDEIQAYMDALQPVIDGWEPNNLFVYGNTGVGKTAVTEYLLDQLEADAETYDDLELTVVSVNCRNLTSSYQVAVGIVNELRPSGGEIAATGYPRQTVYNKLWDELDRLGGTVLVVLDEIDAIGESDSLLYELPRARSNGHLEDVKPGLIGISNDFTFRENLGPRVRDSLCERELHFPPYEAAELERILDTRAEKAIADGALGDGTLSLCAALAARDRGSARQALDLLLYAGDLASAASADAITDDHVYRAQQEIEQERVTEGMHELTHHGHLSLLAVVWIAASGQTPERGREIYDRYTSLCSRAGVEELGQRAIHNHLSDLRMLGILTAEENRTGSRGNYYLYDLAVPLHSALEALDQELRVPDIISEIRTRSDQKTGN
jgi:cell division control protein 6